MESRREDGQALLLALGAAFALIVAALALVAIAGAVTGKGRAQRAADLAAISAARSMRDDLPRLLAPPVLPNGLPNPAHIEKAAYLARARLAALTVARGNGVEAGRVRIGFPDAASFAPVRVKATVVGRLELGAPGETQRVAEEVEASALAEAAAPSTGGGAMPDMPAAAVTAARSSTGRGRGCAPTSPPPSTAWRLPPRGRG